MADLIDFSKLRHLREAETATRQGNAFIALADIDEEFQLPPGAAAAERAEASEPVAAEPAGIGGQMDERMMRLEKSIVSVLSILKKIVATPAAPADQRE